MEAQAKERKQTRPSAEFMAIISGVNASTTRKTMQTRLTMQATRWWHPQETKWQRQVMMHSREMFTSTKRTRLHTMTHQQVSLWRWLLTACPKGYNPSLSWHYRTKMMQKLRARFYSTNVAWKRGWSDGSLQTYWAFPKKCPHQASSQHLSWKCPCRVVLADPLLPPNDMPPPTCWHFRKILGMSARNQMTCHVMVSQHISCFFWTWRKSHRKLHCIGVLQCV